VKAVLATVRKELLILVKDPAALVLLFILPAIFIAVLSLAMQGAFAQKDGAEKFSILVVNQDAGDFGDKLIENINVNGYFEVAEQDDVDIAKRLVAEGERSLLLVIPKSATRGLTRETKERIVLYQDPAFSKEMAMTVMNGIREFIYVTLLDKLKDATIKQSDAIQTLESQLDDTVDKLKSAAQIARDLQRRFEAMRRGPRFGRPQPFEIGDTDADSDSDGFDAEIKKPGKVKSISASAGLKVEQQFLTASGRGADRPTSTQQNVPGWTIFALFWIAQVLAINIISERQSGAFRRVMVSPVSFYTYILSKAIPFLFINLIQAVVLFLLGVYVLPHFGCARLEIHNIPALTVLTIAVSLTAVSFALTLAGFLKTPFAAASVSASILVVMTALAGIMVPKFVMPEAMQHLTVYVPQGIALEGYLDVLLRGRGIAELMPAVGKLLAFAVGFSALGLLRMRRTR
jgi:ABC-2 type transport system permease protein